jgi:hypothetical protein
VAGRQTAEAEIEARVLLAKAPIFFIEATVFLGGATLTESRATVFLGEATLTVNAAALTVFLRPWRELKRP